VRIELHPEAIAEARAAAVWYEELNEGAGDDLLDEIDAALERIAHCQRRGHPGPESPTVKCRYGKARSTVSRTLLPSKCAATRSGSTRSRTSDAGLSTGTLGPPNAQTNTGLQADERIVPAWSTGERTVEYFSWG
jgi:hypothetical protein